MSAVWKQRPEGGGRFALWLIRGIGRHGGRAVARALLYPITAYFLLRRAPERRASLAWLRVAIGPGVGWGGVARHIHAFASTILDRVFLLSGELHRFDIRIRGADPVHAHLDAGRGVLLFGSHLGSFEVLRVLATQRPNLPVRVVLDKAHNQAITDLLDALNPAVAATVIDAAQDGPSILFEIQQALAAGQLVALLVDRAQPGEAVQAASFFGRDATFPLAPWQLAVALGAPVVLAFGLYRGGNRYDLCFEAFSQGEVVPRARRAVHLAALIRRYAARLEHHARQAPFNWFNFYDYWEIPPVLAAPRAGRDAGLRDRHAAGRA